MNENHSQYALPLDTMIQEYRIVGVLGARSFGIVYIAENKYFNETVAFKEFLPPISPAALKAPVFHLCLPKQKKPIAGL